jgi:LysM repeat protein/lysophospholipase L1-like esterase
MIMKLYLLSLLSILLFVHQACGQPAPIETVCLEMLPSSADTLRYDWLKPRYNLLQFYSKKAIENFHQKWKQSHHQKLSIAHFGDSHLQPDIFPGQLRKRLHELHGDGGRGIMFAYSTAKTYSSVAYKTAHTGVWQAERALTTKPKLPLGVSGMAARTTQAGATLQFVFEKEVPEHYDMVKIFCQQKRSTFDLILQIDDTEIPVSLDSSDVDYPFVAIPIPKIHKKIMLKTVQNHQDENEFEFYSLSLESSADKGAILHNGGVGAARYQSLLYQSLFPEQLPALEPDLVILDFGTNDILYYDKIDEHLEAEIRQIIALIRQKTPQSAILLTTAHDLYWKGKNVKSGRAFAALIHKIAKDTDCIVYDWYWIFGGSRAMAKWAEAGLAQNDKIHLSASGSRLKGDLLFEAMNNTMVWLEEHKEAQALVFDVSKEFESITTQLPLYASTQKSTGLSANQTQSQAPKQAQTQIPIKTQTEPHAHTIQWGETLSHIALRYGVTISQLKKWNQLAGDKIRAGQKLIIYTQKILR